jgi:hypothetical protein
VTERYILSLHFTNYHSTTYVSRSIGRVTEPFHLLRFPAKTVFVEVVQVFVQMASSSQRVTGEAILFGVVVTVILIILLGVGWTDSSYPIPKIYTPESKR